MPLVKIFNPYGQGKWLIFAQDPEHPDALIGLCDLGQGFPEVGYVSLNELSAVRIGGGLPLERDLYFEATHSMAAYVAASRLASEIVEGADMVESGDGAGVCGCGELARVGVVVGPPPFFAPNWGYIMGVGAGIGQRAGVLFGALR